MRNGSKPGVAGARTGRAPVITAILALLLAAPAQGQQSVPPEPGSAEAAIERALESRSKGSESARIVVFEIADFQCPYCARFAETVGPALHERYVDTGDVHWVFVNLPLHTHPLAWHAAEAALCAGAAGGQFWAMHDRLFAEQDEWGGSADPGARFAAYAAELGVPSEAFATCTREDQVAALIVQDMGSAMSAGITGTPTFIVMRDQQVIERVVGIQPVEEWARILDTALGR